MLIPHVYWVAFAMMIRSMLCRGSWANTQRLCKGWPSLRWPRLSNEGKTRNVSYVFCYKDMLNE